MPTVHASLAELLGFEGCQLTAFAFTEPCLADGLILTSRMPEEDATALVSALTRMSRDGSDTEPLLGLFYIEGFTLASSLKPETAPQAFMARRTEYLAVDLDEQDRCQRLWSSTGMAFGRPLPESGGHTLSEVLPPEAASAAGGAGAHGAAQWRGRPVRAAAWR